MSAFARNEEDVLYEAINRGLVALRRGDWALADTIARSLEPRIKDGQPVRPDVSAIDRFKKEIKASGRPI
jgi:hypothetical protein